MSGKQKAKKGKAKAKAPTASKRKGNARSKNPKLTAAPISYGLELMPFSRIHQHPRHETGIILEGRDLLDSISTPGALNQGTAIANLLLSPVNFDGTRMKQLASSWDFFRFKRFKVIANPGQATSSIGQVVMSWDPDPSDPTPPVSLIGVREYLAHRCSVTGTTWQPLEIEVKPEDENVKYYTNHSHGSGSDERLSYQGQIYLATATYLPSTAQWSLWIEYELEFWEPSLEETQVQVVTAVGTSYNTPTGSTSYSLWNNLTSSALVGTTTEVPVMKDSDGNTYFHLEPGVYELVQLVSNMSTSGATIEAPVFIKEDPTVSGGSHSVLNLWSVLSNAGASAINPQSLSRRDMVQIAKTAYRMYGAATALSAGGLGRLSILQSLNGLLL